MARTVLVVAGQWPRQQFLRAVHESQIELAVGEHEEFFQRPKIALQIVVLK